MHGDGYPQWMKRGEFSGLMSRRDGRGVLAATPVIAG
jgi:hypothetical protein